MLNHGRIAERGSHAELMAIDGGIYQRLVQLQQLETDDDADAANAPDTADTADTAA